MIRVIESLLALTLGMSVVPSGRATEADLCPALPANSGLAWQLSKGPDFSVCYAVPVKQPAGGVIGVYLGFHPSFKPEEATALRPGIIGGEPITWYVKQPGSSTFAVGAEAIHQLKPHVAHIWVLAPSQPELVKLIQTAEQLRFGRPGEL